MGGGRGYVEPPKTWRIWLSPKIITVFFEKKKHWIKEKRCGSFRTQEKEPRYDISSHGSRRNRNVFKKYYSYNVYLPSKRLTYSTLGKRKSSSKMPWEQDILVPIDSTNTVFFFILYFWNIIFGYIWYLLTIYLSQFDDITFRL